MNGTPHADGPWTLFVIRTAVKIRIAEYGSYEDMLMVARYLKAAHGGQWSSASGGILHWRQQGSDLVILGDLSRYHTEWIDR